MPEDLLMEETPKAKKKKAKRMGAKSPSKQGVHVNVNVVNTHGDAHKKPVNQADDALSKLRGY